MQVKIFNEESKSREPALVTAECEKADLDSCEKERTDNGLSLPLPSTSISNPSNLLNMSPVVSPLVLCMLKEECENFKKNILLPGKVSIPIYKMCKNYKQYVWHQKMYPYQNEFQINILLPKSWSATVLTATGIGRWKMKKTQKSVFPSVGSGFH